MKTIELIQGSQEWLDVRAKHFTASEAPAMLGMSKYTTRQQLLAQKATGYTEDVDASKQRLFDRGHDAEAAARPIAEKVIEEDLYPATGSAEVEGLPLLASFDGITMDESIVWEHKLLNSALAAAVDSGEVPDAYWPQLEQQLLVSGANKAFFVTSDGTAENMHGCWYMSVPDRRAQLIAGWKQFAEDLANYQHVEVIPAAVAAPVEDLPAVFVQVSGAIDVASNFTAFEAALRDFVDNRLIRKPQTDQDFADLGNQIKSLEKAEAALIAAESSMLSQVASVDAMKRTKDMLYKLARDNRLMAEKLLEAEKTNRRNEIMQEGKQALAEHIAGLNKRLGRVLMPPINIDFAGAMRGKKTITSLKGAVADALAAGKSEATQAADRIQINLETLETLGKDFPGLFADLVHIAAKDCDDFTALVKTRIADQKAADEKRLEADRERIRKEEQARAERELAEKDAAEKREADRIAAEKKAAEQVIVDADNARRAEENALSKAALLPSSSVWPIAPPTAVLSDKNVADANARSFVDSIADNGAMMKTGEICDRLGFIVKAEFLESLGFKPAAIDKAAKLYKVSQFPAICEAIIRHIEAVSVMKDAA